MTMTQIEPTSPETLQPLGGDWKTKWMAIGGAVGALLGVAAVYLYIRSIETEQGTPATEPRPIKPSSAVQVALSVLTALRQFASLGLD
jgi:hypothetical protein